MPVASPPTTLRTPAEAPGELVVPTRVFGLVLAAQLPIALMVNASPLLSTVHAAVVLLIGMAVAMDPTRPDRVACMAAYIAGCDVLWRMTGAGVFHQFGKYAIAAILFVGMLRGGRYRGLAAPLLYIALLLPSIALVRKIPGYAPGIVGSISFNLSGPITLAMSMMFFRQLELTRDELAGVFASLAAGVLTVLIVAAQATIGAQRITFTGESNFVTSGGFGPNQVSAMLGLGALAIVLAGVMGPRRMFSRPVLWVLGLAFMTQCLLTLSRGGAYAAIGALCLAAPFLISRREERGRIVVRVIAIGALLALFVVPMLDEFTGGAFLRRFSDQRLAGRGLLMMRDLAVWEQNPVFGVGPGMSRLSRVEGFNVTLVHTEFTRMVAEHGLMGVLSLIALITVAIQNIATAPSGRPRFTAAALCAWSALFMVAVAFRLSAPALCIGLSGVLVAGREPEPIEDEREPALDDAP